MGDISYFIVDAAGGNLPEGEEEMEGHLPPLHSGPGYGEFDRL